MSFVISAQKLHLVTTRVFRLNVVTIKKTISNLGKTNQEIQHMDSTKIRHHNKVQNDCNFGIDTFSFQEYPDLTIQ